VASSGTIDDLLDGATRDVAGVVAVATTASGTIYEGASGVRSVGGMEPMTLDTVFALASMTKPIASVAALQLVERGKLELDAPVASVLSQLDAPSVLTGFDDRGDPVLRPATGDVSVRPLLTHTSGYGYGFLDADLQRHHEQQGVGLLPTSWNELAAEPLLFDPGTRWSYGIGTDVLGKVIEEVTGQPLDECLHEHVLGPLAMLDTRVVLRDDQRARAARLHVRAGEGLVAVDSPVGGERSFCMGGAALCGTGPDYARFLRMVLRHGELDGATVLSRNAVLAMGASQIGGLEVSPPLRTANPLLSNDIDLLPGTPVTWGLGFLINTAASTTGRRAGSLAWAGLYNTYFWIDPDAGVAGVLLAQVLPFADAPVLELFGAFEQVVYDSLL
jgi:methyl acetate hydrolase